MEKQQHALTLMSSRSKKFSMMPFLFQMIGGRNVPWIAQVRTALRPTVTVETLICWSSARLSCTTSVRMRVWTSERQITCRRQTNEKMEEEGEKRMAEKITNQNECADVVEL